MSERNLNEARYYIDFVLMPKLFTESPGGIDGMMNNGRGEEFFCRVFNEVLGELRTFDVSEFKVTKHETDTAWLYYVNVPIDHESASVWCEAYGFAYTKTSQGILCQYFTVEQTDETRMLCSVDGNLGRANYGWAKDTDQENVDMIFNLIRPNPVEVEL